MGQGGEGRVSETGYVSILQSQPLLLVFQPTAELKARWGTQREFRQKSVPLLVQPDCYRTPHLSAPASLISGMLLPSPEPLLTGQQKEYREGKPKGTKFSCLTFQFCPN